MAITTYSGNTLIGLSSDTKPTTIPDGARFYESDTGEVHLKVSGVWGNKNAEAIKALSDRLDALEAV